MRRIARSLVRISAVLALASSAVLVGASGAHAAAGWLQPVYTSPDSTDSIPGGNDVAMDANGNLVAVYAQYVDVGNGTFRFAVKAVTRLAGGSFTSEKTISDTSVDAYNPLVEMDANGNAIIVWEGGGLIELKTWSASGGFGATQDVGGSANPGSGAYGPALAVLPDGTAYITWQRAVNNGNSLVVQSVIRSAAGSYSAAKDISTPHADFYANRLMANSAGDVTAFWATGDFGPAYGVFAARTSGGAQFGNPGTEQTVQSTASVAYDVQGAVDTTGRALLVWSREGTLTFASRTGAAFGAAQTTLDPGSDADGAQVAMDNEGTAIVAWYANLGSAYEIRAAVKPSGGAFGAVQPLSDAGTGTPFSPTVGIDRASNSAIVVWPKSDYDSASGVYNYFIQSARRPPSGSFGAVTDVATDPGGQSVRLASDTNGNAVADFAGFYYRSSPCCEYHYSHGLVGFDGAAPKLDNVNVPAAATATKAAAMSLTASDVWSGFGVSWNFGDGATAAGANVAHAYAMPGTYTVTATTTDAVGNSSSTQRTIQVATNDADGDGSPAGQDCDDDNPAIRPGAPDIPGNAVDEDCNGVLALKRVDSRVSYVYLWFGARTAFSQLDVARVPKGATVRLRCKGSSCPRKSKELSIKKSTKKLKLAKYLRRGKRPARLKTGTVVTVLVSHPQQIGISTRLTVGKRKKAPKRRDGCVAAGSTKKTACP